jgi:hypothetical protein
MHNNLLLNNSIRDKLSSIFSGLFSIMFRLLLCYRMLCFVMPTVMLCYVKFCFVYCSVLLCYVMLCFVMSLLCYARWWRARRLPSGSTPGTVRSLL